MSEGNEANSWIFSLNMLQFNVPPNRHKTISVDKDIRQWTQQHEHPQHVCLEASASTCDYCIYIYIYLPVSLGTKTNP